MAVGVRANTRTHTPPNTKAQELAPRTGQWICQPRGCLGSQPTLLRVHREVAWRGDAGPPLCQVSSEDMGCGSQGRPDVTWACRAGLPACRKVALPFVVMPAPVPVLTCLRGSEQAVLAGWALKGSWSWEFGSLGPQRLSFLPWKSSVWAPFGSPAHSRKGGRMSSFHPGKHHYEQ